MRSHVLGCVAISLALAGCRSAPQITALDGLISSRMGVGSGQTALMNLHSLSLEPGVIVRLPSNNGRATTSAMVEHTTSPESYLRMETYEPDKHTDMASIRAAIEDITFTIGKQVSARIDKAKAASLEQKSQDNLAKASQQAATDKSDDEQRVESSRKTLIDSAISKNAPADTINALVTAPLPTPKSDAASEKVNLAATAAKESGTRAKATEETANKGEEDLATKQHALSLALSKPNVVVFRWNTGDNDSGALNLFGKSETQAQQKRQSTGYAILNGMRRVRLVVGEDLVTGSGVTPPAALRILKGIANAGEVYDSYRGVIVTSILQTREIMYFTAEDLEQSFREKLDLKVSDLTAAGLSPEDIANLKIQAELDSLRLRSVQNSGYFTSPRLDMIKIDNWDRVQFLPNKLIPPDRGSTGIDPLPHSDWITIHAVTTTIGDLLSQRRNAHVGSIAD